jgi:hypothetical protein
MALKLKFENDHYQKILIDQSFIDVNGLYIGSIVLKSKDERDKDKNREDAIKVFVNNVNLKNQQIRDDESLSDSEKEEEYTKLYKALTVARYIDDCLYVIEGFERRLTLTEENISESEKYGFDRIWYDDPVVIERVDRMWIEEYNKQNFDLETFYERYRNKYNSAGLETEDV